MDKLSCGGWDPWEALTRGWLTYTKGDLAAGDWCPPEPKSSRCKAFAHTFLGWQKSCLSVWYSWQVHVLTRFPWDSYVSINVFTGAKSKLLLSDVSLHLTDNKGNTSPSYLQIQFNRMFGKDPEFVMLKTILEVSQIRRSKGQMCMHISAQHGSINVLRKLTKVWVLSGKRKSTR